MIGERLRLSDKTSQNSGKCDCFFEGAARILRSKSLKVEGKIVLDWCRRLNGFNFKSCTNICKSTGAKRQRLWMMRLPVLVFGAEVEGARVLEVRWQNNRLVTRLTWQLDPQIPCIQGHKRKFQVVGQEMLLCELVKPIDGFAEGTGMLDMFPG
jgi:hypothetical protein